MTVNRDFVFASAAGTALADGGHGARHAFHRRNNGLHGQAALSYLDRNPQAAWHSNSCTGVFAFLFSLEARRSAVVERSIVNTGCRRQTLARGTLCAADRDAADRLGYAIRGRLSDRALWLFPSTENPPPRRSAIRGFANRPYPARIYFLCDHPATHRRRIFSRLDPPGRGVSSDDAFEAEMTRYTCSNAAAQIVIRSPK